MQAKVIAFVLDSSLQRHNAENWKQIFPEMELRSLSPNFHIHVSVSDIPRIGLPFLLKENMRKYKKRSQTHELGGHAIPFLGIHKWDFRCSATYRPKVKEKKLTSLSTCSIRNLVSRYRNYRQL
jgi:hypothetical protein